jgi:hypothetical protein
LNHTIHSLLACPNVVTQQSQTYQGTKASEKGKQEKTAKRREGAKTAVEEN